MNTPLRAIIVLTGALACGALGCGAPKSDTMDAGSAPQAVAGPQASAAPIAPDAPGVLREEIMLTVGGAPERWALVWRRPPVPVCGANDAADALTCPCAGFAYGEQGELDLVRRRAGRADERLALTPLFRDGEHPAGQLAVLQRWPVLETDYALADSADLAPTVRVRPVTRAIVLGDYDHDGRATEFLLQIGTLPCGKRQAVLVGLSATDSSLHAFPSLAHPEQPLVLTTSVWDALRQSDGHATGIEWRCADHGSETQTEITLQAGPRGIDGTRSEYACTPGGARGRLLHTERI